MLRQSLLALTLSTSLLAGCTTPPHSESKIQKQLPHTLYPTESIWGGDAIPSNPITPQPLIAAVLHEAGKLALLTFNEQGTLQELTPPVPLGAYHPDSAAAWDQNTFAVGVEITAGVQFWRWDGQKLTEVAERISAPFAVRDLVVADLDADGQKDLVLAPYDGEANAILWGKGDFKFSPPQLLKGKTTANHPHIMDWNGDGKPDILVPEWASGIVRIWLNQGNRQFKDLILSNERQEVPRFVSSGDIDGDGRSDVLVALETSPYVRIIYNKPEGPVSEKLPLPFQGGSVATAILRDNTLLIAKDEQIFLTRKIDGQWQFRTLKVGSLPSPIVAKDLNGDAIEDLVTFNSANTGVTGYLGPLWEKALPFNPQNGKR